MSADQPVTYGPPGPGQVTVGSALDHRALPDPPNDWRGPTPNSVVFRLVELSRLLDDATAEVERRQEEWVRAKQRYEVGYARAFLTSDKTSDMKRKYDAVDVTADLRLESEIAEALMKAARDRLNTVKEQIEIGRSLGAAARAEWAATTWTQS